MTEFKYEEHVSRRLAAERLADIAYALGAGGTLELRTAHERVCVPVAEEMRLERTTTSEDGRVEVTVELTWSVPSAAARRE